jgi:integrase|tara:strand:+ start:281 stop:1342 length:1062 start_codon:yes stop_codon:yes gene_type:complete
MKLNYPKVHLDQNQKVFISFFINNKRFRIYNGKRIGSETNPNSFPINQRKEIGNLLAAEVYSYVNNGGLLSGYRTKEIISGNITDKVYLSRALNSKLEGDLSPKYKTMLRFVYNGLTPYLNNDKLTSKGLKSYLCKYKLGVSYNTIKRHLNVLINEARSLGMQSNPMVSIKAKKSKAKLHKPYPNIKEILDEVKMFNSNLYLCCLITYGCLLRPHREIRGLTWSDFSDDLKYIHLSGNRNKSGRNRIVPVPIYIRELLIKGEPHHNIFSGKPKPLNQDYFKTLWSRFKRVSKLLEQDQTLYSFRHSGAIEIFKRTGSITKLQKAMGHSSINVSLTYLRGLEIAELKEEDMPMV